MSKSKKDGGVDFKDLDLFNVALLSKQAWCVVVNQEVVRVRVLKKIYFPFSGFLLAKSSKSSSWGWRSLLEGREALASDYGGI